MPGAVPRSSAPVTEPDRLLRMVIYLVPSPKILGRIEWTEAVRPIPTGIISQDLPPCPFCILSLAIQDSQRVLKSSTDVSATFLPEFCSAPNHNYLSLLQSFASWLGKFGIEGGL